jgi:diaminopimelate decarboxylase
VGIDFHIGSTLMDTAPAIEATQKVLSLVDTLGADGHAIEHIDVGGGLGIPYRGEAPVDLDGYAQKLLALFAGRRERLLFEPGRYLVGGAGLLLTRTLYLKHGPDKDFAVVDAAMNDLLRPALYDAYHDIAAVVCHPGEPRTYEVVGPVCESGDFLGHERILALREDDLLAVLDAGAYGMAMSSNYNTRPRACEILVDRDQPHLIRPREDAPALFSSERLLPK